MSAQQLNDAIIQAAVDKTLDALGAVAKSALWTYLEQVSGFTPKNFTQNIEGFQNTLQKFFGVGYEFLNVLLCQNLCNLTHEKREGNSTLLELVNALREKASNETPALATCTNHAVIAQVRL